MLVSHHLLMIASSSCLNLVTGAAAWTEPIARVFGLPLDRAPKNIDEFIELVHPDDRQTERQRFDQALAGGSLYQSEFRQNLPDGQIRWVAGRGKFIRDESGRPMRHESSA